MNHYAVAGLLVSLILLSGVGLAWQAYIASPDLSPAQKQFLDVLDWLLKGSTGALTGFVACWASHRRNRRN